jgi:hypothetical protein
MPPAQPVGSAIHFAQPRSRPTYRGRSSGHSSSIHLGPQHAERLLDGAADEPVDAHQGLSACAGGQPHASP